MRVLVQNLQKQSGLATEMMQKYQPDVMLLQEINLRSESGKTLAQAHNTSRLGYGTAIYICSNYTKHNEYPTDSTALITETHKVESPYAEFGGFIHKKTTVTTLVISNTSSTVQTLQLVSFHGYNGQPFKSVPKLMAHIDAVLSVLHPDGPVVFAGDFNTWPDGDHLAAVRTRLEGVGFHLAFSWPYPPHQKEKHDDDGEVQHLDHAFLRGNVRLDDSSFFSSKSDHLGALLDITIS